MLRSLLDWIIDYFRFCVALSLAMVVAGLGLFGVVQLEEIDGLNKWVGRGLMVCVGICAFALSVFFFSGEGGSKRVGLPEGDRRLSIVLSFPGALLVVAFLEWHMVATGYFASASVEWETVVGGILVPLASALAVVWASLNEGVRSLAGWLRGGFQIDKR